MNKRRNRLYCAPFCLASILTLPKIVGATDFAWLGGADSQWSNKNNWNPIGIPNNGDNANVYGYSPSGIISLNVNYDSSVTPASIGTFNLGGDSDGSLTTSAATLNIMSGTLNAAHEFIGIFITSSATAPEYGQGVVNHSGGTNNVSFLTIGDQQNYDVGVYNLSGTGVLNVGTYEVIGYPLLGNATFTQSGGTHTAAALYVGGTYNFSAGTLNANNTSIGGGTLTQTGGSGTVGSLTISSILVGPFGIMIPTPGSVSTTAGSLTATSYISNGSDAAGTLSIGGTGQVTTPELDNYGTLQLSGGTLDFTTLLNNGTFSWTGGALVSELGVTFDNLASPGSFGGMFGSTLSLNSSKTLKIGGTETLGNTGSFTLAIPAGGSNIVRQLNISSKGKVNLTGGTLTCTAIDLVGQNTLFNWTAGTLNLLNAATFDPNASTLTTGSIFGTTLALNSRTLTAPTETLTSTSIVRGQTFALSVGANGNNLVSGALTVDSLGSLTVGGGTVSAGTTNVQSGGKLLYSSGTFSPGALNVLGTGVATFSATSSTVVMTSLAVDSTAKLDIGSTKLIIHSADQNALRITLQTGYDGGAWDKGLRSSQALGNPMIGIGYLLNTGTGGNPLYATFGGQPAIATDTLVRVTYVGDANLDGQVDIKDLMLLAHHWNQPSQFWNGGDFNYDGVVNVNDLYLLAKDWQAGVGSPMLGLNQALSEVAAETGVSVPEPTSITLLAFGLAGLARRRRR